MDYARVWAGTYQTCAGRFSGGALNGSDSTVERWANSIGSTAAHEAGHNYGLSHADGEVPLTPGEDAPLSPEDARKHHLMRAGSVNGMLAYSFDDRARGRHFSDHEYSVLASNVGLAMDTMWNWDFINPVQRPVQSCAWSFLAASKHLSFPGRFQELPARGSIRS